MKKFFPVAIISTILFFTLTTHLSAQSEDIPYYFIAIHNEPYNVTDGRKMIERDYSVLKEMIERANAYRIKLTLMFSPQWADYIAESTERLAEVELWRRQGHEIAGHHHSIYHGNWDGYTNYSKEEAQAQRIRQGRRPEEYLGTLKIYIEHLRKINVDIKSGCMNDEIDKCEMPDEVVYDTCSGFSNYGKPGRREDDGSTPDKGKNEYITMGRGNGIERKWLTHFHLASQEHRKAAQGAFSSMDCSVYGVVVHSFSGELEPYLAFLEFLHSKDPKGRMSKTVSEIVESKIISERRVSDDIINERLDLPRKGRCGDGVCDEFERENPMFCPGDCR